MVVPAALKVVRLKLLQVCLPRRLAHEVGWKYQAVTATLEEKERKAVYRKKRSSAGRLRKQAERTSRKKTGKFTEVLKAHGFLV